ncbi:MAG: response regulator [Thiomicrorhabdus chilensis]|uniref:HD domain-containing phosphohydrolase n=1 Tax=Thiomicrorhabdus chilensis TaxID=63656 RepID=UPI00299DD8C2|nr:HD domain-containing phosphohydrolase [Thiomicrorhabdus chilensis]MDX1347778.1 response regulator [Thiomicrorhabdus chilensis]
MDEALMDETLRQACILVVDDQAVNLELIADFFEEYDYTNTITCSNPLNISMLLNENSVDLILLDINMPVLDGFGVLSIIRQHFQESNKPPVIMLTAQNDQENRNKALDSGANDYVMKPFNQKELLRRVELQLENWFLRKQLQQQNESLDQKVRQRTQALNDANLEIVHRLGRAGEYRDNETGNHVKRVSLFSYWIARQAGLGERRARLIELGSPMHDIGKIGVSDTILLKPGKLTEEEYAKMQDHVIIGARILENSQSEILKVAHRIALTHHEKFDGKGYPHGLAGEDIPIEGRIVAIADVFDALTSERPYKAAWSVEKAIGLLEKEKGRHFDPNLVDCFIQVLPEVLKIRNTYFES